jgi:dTDP-4-dehydrorhamnose reductase
MTPLRIAVTGKNGQVVKALMERATANKIIIPVSRPELDLTEPKTVVGALDRASPDIIVNAAAYTMVDKAEQEPETAHRVNAEGAATVARAAKELGVPLIHLSTDYIFNGALDRPYGEDDPVDPLGAYGRSKLEGERLIAEEWHDHVILRTAWVYSPFGANFLKTMLRLGAERSELGVVADQYGNPTSAFDIADAVLAIAERLARDPSSDLRGIFHLSGSGATTWADFAEAIFACAQRRGRLRVTVRRITTAEYPTPAKRPANSRLDNEKLRRRYGITLPDWRVSLAPCVDRLLNVS